MRVNRLPPALPVGSMQTYQVAAPPATHWRKATCAEVNCEHYANGWATTVLPGGEDEATLRRCGRRFTVEPQPGGMLRFIFPAEQPCFRAAVHRVPLERPALYVVRGGDWRAAIGERRVHKRAEDWVDDFANHQDRLATRLNRG